MEDEIDRNYFGYICVICKTPVEKDPLTDIEPKSLSGFPMPLCVECLVDPDSGTEKLKRNNRLTGEIFKDAL